jgi:predicted lipid-binding transport protein (Tim44 family)
MQEAWFSRTSEAGVVLVGIFISGSGGVGNGSHRRRRRASRRAQAAREHGHGARGDHKQGAHQHQPKPPSAHPARIARRHRRINAQVGVQPGAHRAQYEAQRWTQNAHADCDCCQEYFNTIVNCSTINNIQTSLIINNMKKKLLLCWLLRLHHYNENNLVLNIIWHSTHL